MFKFESKECEGERKGGRAEGESTKKRMNNNCGRGGENWEGGEGEAMREQTA